MVAPRIRSNFRLTGRTRLSTLRVHNGPWWRRQYRTVVILEVEEAFTVLPPGAGGADRVETCWREASARELIEKIPTEADQLCALLEAGGAKK
jgi:hypothetical protein